MLVLYHGARRWELPIQIQPGRAKRTEHGPGLYLTTSIETARKYAKGGGFVVRIELDERLRWIDSPAARAHIDSMKTFLRAVSRLRNRAAIIDDLQRYAARVSRQDLPIEVLVNLMVNHDALVGDVAPKLAEFLVEQGVDAAHVRQSNEDWVVLFNPDKVLRAERLADRDARDLDRIQRI